MLLGIDACEVMRAFENEGAAPAAPEDIVGAGGTTADGAEPRSRFGDTAKGLDGDDGTIGIEGGIATLLPAATSNGVPPKLSADQPSGADELFQSTYHQRRPELVVGQG